MADKKFSIEISAIGGAAAAAEVQKVEQALSAVSVSEEELAQKRAGFLSAAEAEVAEIDRMVRSAQTLKAANEANAVTLTVLEEKVDRSAAAFGSLEKALGIVTNSEEELAQKRAGFLSAAEAEVAEVERMVSSGARLKVANEANVVSLGSLEKELREATIAYRAAEIGSENFHAASKRLDVAHQALTTAQGKVTASGLTMKGSMQNVGYQVQDLAVQIGAGTSAFTALGQQAPQLLSGFGPVGIALGTISAIALPLAGALFNLGDAASDAGSKAEDSAERLEKLRDAQAKVIKTQIDESWANFVKALDDQDAAVSRANTALQRRKELMDQIASAQDKLDASKSREEIAIIDADQSLTPEQKIRKKAEIQDRDAKAAAEKDIAKIESTATDAEAVALAKQTAAKVAADKLAQIRAEKEKEDAERAEIEKREKGRLILEKQIPAAEGNAKSKGTKAEILSYMPFILPYDDYKSIQDEATEANKGLQELQNKAAKNPQDAARLAALQKRKSETEALLKERQDEADKLAAEANEAGLDAETKRQAASEVVPRLKEASARDSNARSSTSNAAADAAADAAKKAADAKRQADKKAAEDAERKRESDAKAADRTAAKAGDDFEKLLPKGVSEGFRRSVEKVRDGLKNGDQGGEVQKLTELMNALADAMLKKSGGSLSNDPKIREIERKLQILQGQIKNSSPK